MGPTCQSCSYPFVPIHSSSRDGPSSPYPKALSPRALFTAAPVAVLPLHELSLPCCSLFSANSLSRALPPSMWRKFFSIHGSEPGRLGGVCAHERGLARVIVTGAGRHVSGAGPVPVISMAVHGARRKTVCIARCGCLRKHT